MRSWTRIAPLVVAFSLLAALVACGGGGDKESAGEAVGEKTSAATVASVSPTAEAQTPAAKATAAEDEAGQPTVEATAAGDEAGELSAELSAKIKAAALTQDDMPEGFTLESDSLETPEEAAQSEDDAEEALDRYRQWKALGFYEAGFSGPTDALVEGGIVSIFQGLMVFKDEDGGKAALSWFKDEERAQDLLGTEEQGEDLKVENMSIGGVGDDSVGWRVSGKVDTGLGEEQLELLLVMGVFRQNKALAMVGIAAVGDVDAEDEVRELCEKLDSRIQEELD